MKIGMAKIEAIVDGHLRERLSRARRQHLSPSDLITVDYFGRSVAWDVIDDLIDIGALQTRDDTCDICRKKIPVESRCVLEKGAVYCVACYSKKERGKA